MHEVAILENETLEDLQIKGLKLIQKKKGFRFGMDSVLLADFAFIKRTDFVADFGTGTGILPLLLYARDKGSHFLALEIQPEMVEMAQRTMRLNHLEDQIEVRQMDIEKSTEDILPCTMDAIVCNPPYGIPGKAVRNQSETLMISRHQNENTLDTFFAAAFKMLKGKGRLFLVYPASQMLQLMTALKHNHLEPKRFRLVYPSLQEGANLVLIEAVKDAKPLLLPLPPLIVFNENRTLTNELKSIYHIKE